MDWTLISAWLLQGLILAVFAIVGLYAGIRLFGHRQAAPLPEPAAPPASLHSGYVEEPLAEGESVRRGYEFSGDRLTIMLEMPAAYLDQERELVETWVESVGWARVERQRLQNEARSAARAAAATPLNDPVHMQQNLDEVLQRLQASAERRRRLRALLDENISKGEPEA